MGCTSMLQAATPVSPKVVPLGDNTYSITREANYLFTRNTDKLKAQAQADAVKFCASQGKQLKVVSLKDDKPFYGRDFVKVMIVFKALDAGDPELASQPASMEAPAHKDDLYAELIKLDDLRKKGILTEEEFTVEKKKVLNRSR